jgi:hypothetical protein
MQKQCHSEEWRLAATTSAEGIPSGESRFYIRGKKQDSIPDKS